MALSTAVPKLRTGKTLREERQERKAEAERELQRCYAEVDARDQKRCRVSGIKLTAGAADPRQRLERHHMLPCSTNPAERANPANVITISAFVHQAVTAHKLHLEGDANLRDETGTPRGVLLSHQSEIGWQPVRLV